MAMDPPIPPSVPAWNVTLVALDPTVGANCRCIGIVDRRRGPSSLGLTEGVKGSVVKVGIVHGSLASFSYCYGGKILRAAITHYKANRHNTGYNELRDCVKVCPKGFPGPAYIGGQT